MKKHFYFFFIFFTLILLFNPGNSELFQIFAFNRKLFDEKKPTEKLLTEPVPYVKTNVAPFTTAEGVYIADLSSFTPVFAKNERERLFPASTTKILTALVTFDLYKPDDVVVIHNVVDDGQVMGLVPGEKITIENLLYGALVYSGNDAAFALADHYGREKFVDLMNKKARDLHMAGSHFQNPAGLDALTQFSTPYDLALAARELLKNKYLAKIVSTKEIVVSDQDFKYFHTLTNVNKLLGEIQGIGGLKTGYTENAGENLVSLYKSPSGHEFIVVVLKSEDRFQDTKNIVQWINANVDYVNIQP